MGNNMPPSKKSIFQETFEVFEFLLGLVPTVLPFILPM